MYHRCLASLAFAAILVGSALTGESKSDDAKNIQGTWIAVAFREGGKSAPDQFLKGTRVKFTKDQFILTANGRDKSMKYRLNPAKKPKEFDVIEDDERVTPGIYELSGDDLKICLSPGRLAPKAEDKDKKGPREPSPRPTDFKGEMKGHVVFILKREK